jgi:hypothetical protein
MLLAAWAKQAHSSQAYIGFLEQIRCLAGWLAAFWARLFKF